MSVYAITFSPTGGTRKVAEILAAAFEPKFRFIDLLPRAVDYSARSFSSCDICVVAVPAFAGRVPAVCAERVKALKGGGAVAVPVVVYGNRAIDDSLLELADLLKEAGFRCAAGISAVAEHSVARQFAAGRPDNEDAEQLREFARSIEARITSDTIPETLTLPGNFPYRPLAGLSMRPMVYSSCIKCGLCAEKCPVGAIPMDDPCATGNDSCISCMACIAVCPMGARKLDDGLLNKISGNLAIHCAERRPNELFM